MKKESTKVRVKDGQKNYTEFIQKECFIKPASLQLEDRRN